MPTDSQQPTTDNCTSSRRLKVLISAYACEPDRGSEPGVGWNVAVAMAKHHDIWVLTRANNRGVIEKKLSEHPVKGLNFFYYDLPKWAIWWKKGGRGVQLYYYLWELFSARIVRELEEQIDFNVVHHVTIVRYWTPSNLRNAEAPLVWGPVGGGESTPRSFKKTFSLKHRIFESARDFVRLIGECDPLVRKTAARSLVALATTEETALRLRHLGVPRVEVMSQLGMSDTFSGATEKKETEPLKFITIGNLVYWKGFDLALRAFAEIASRANAELIIVGTGPEHDSLKILTQKLGIENAVQFRDWMPQSELHKLLAACDVLVHPSFHDSGAFVCLEAMAFGKPVICLDLGGPAVQVTDETGVKVGASNPEQVLHDLSFAMQRLAEDPNLRQQMGKTGLKRVNEHFLWDKKAEYFSSLYLQLAERKETKQLSY